ncbi:hypothetical protein L1049_016369 [Liquidambar formosana]|uniref:Peptidoglycan binding-like domain-containing protein n=1 Tax=Liquidambar formosana TaxID=63359 RepID=A0AAP0S0K9_LIQFO
MASSLPLPLNVTLSLSHKSHHPLQFILTPFPISRPSSFHSHTKSQILAASSPPNPSDFEREEVRWLREEQRWLREEQRWLRQESRWHSERESLLREISDLKLKIEALERQNSMQGASISETIANVAAMLQVLKETDLGPAKNRIAESGSSASPMALEAQERREEEEVVVEEMVVKEIRVVEKEEGEVKKVKRRALRKGSEGDEVRAMQEALQKLGFYSGEEDMEYSSFSSGTERAVKTWQATQGAPEDGIMSAELLERLYMEQQIEGSGLTINAALKGNEVIAPPKEVANGAAFSSVTEFSEIQQTVVREDGVKEVDVTQHRVFLLGENRWEEPSRLIDRDNQVGGSKTRSAATKCLTCRGEGRLLCTECDGTGEPNIEEQFLEWVDEGAKCPYCEGLGYTICDLCEGKPMI